MKKWQFHNKCHLCCRGEDVPPGFIHLLLCSGTSKKEVYSTCYKLLKKAGVGGSKRTLVYPGWMRDIIRNRFQQPGGQFDEQYDQRPDVSEIVVFCIKITEITYCIQYFMYYWKKLNETFIFIYL